MAFLVSFHGLQDTFLKLGILLNDREIPLPSSQFVIGRKSECHLRPKSEKVSKLHCAIGRKGGRVVVLDLKSRNGTLINGDHAGRLIEAAGLKGAQQGNVQISPVHANFFINVGGAGTAADYHALVRLTQERVAAQFDVQLEPEIGFVGDFSA